MDLLSLLYLIIKVLIFSILNLFNLAINDLLIIFNGLFGLLAAVTGLGSSFTTAITVVISFTADNTINILLLLPIPIVIILAVYRLWGFGKR